jgi:hypothetical protein
MALHRHASSNTQQIFGHGLHFPIAATRQWHAPSAIETHCVQNQDLDKQEEVEVTLY